MRIVTRARAAVVCAALLPGAVLSGCSAHSSGDQSYAHQSATDTAASAPLSAAAPAKTATSAGEIAPTPEITNWSDANIVAKLAVGDSGEVQIGRLAESKATTRAVKEYARLLVSDHSKGVKEVASLEKKASLSPAPANTDTTAKGVEDMLQALKATPAGTGWDSTFVQGELATHKHDIADAEAMQKQAKDAQLRQLIGSDLPVLQKHLSAAQKLLGSAPWKSQQLRKTPKTN